MTYTRVYAIFCNFFVFLLSVYSSRSLASQKCSIFRHRLTSDSYRRQIEVLSDAKISKNVQFWQRKKCPRRALFPFLPISYSPAHHTHASNKSQTLRYFNMYSLFHTVEPSGLVLKPLRLQRYNKKMTHANICAIFCVFFAYAPLFSFLPALPWKEGRWRMEYGGKVDKPE